MKKLSTLKKFAENTKKKAENVKHPELRGVFLYQDYMIVSNSHLAVKTSNPGEWYDTPVFYSYDKKEVVELSNRQGLLFKTLSKLFPSIELENVYNMFSTVNELKEWRLIMELALCIEPKHITLDTYIGEFEARNEKNETFKHEKLPCANPGNFRVNFDPKYFLNVLNLDKKSGAGIYFSHGKMNPIRVSFPDYEAVIMPVRTY